MNQSLYPRPRRRGGVLFILGWLIAVALGAWLVWYGFIWSGGGRQSDEGTPAPSAVTITPIQATAWPAVTPLPSPTQIILPTPTDTPLPSPTPLPTVAPPTDTPVVASVVAGADGVNVRSGPGTSYTRLGYLEPGTQAELIGSHEGWWQITHDGAPAWVSGDWVTASNTENVPQVEPPPSPVPATAVPATAAPTAVPATVTPANYRGLVPDGYQVEGAPGPYAVGADIWFNMWIKNTTGNVVEFNALGTFVEETGQFQRSYSYSEFKPGQHFDHRDRINQFSLGPGTYSFWMMICFTDDQCFKMMGPVTVIIQ
ncbi:MAG: SH3 domain-containing protein [Chloroflexota bacterium]|nr:SH3 domain-containing protein [Chloroflexota bacterium]